MPFHHSSVDMISDSRYLSFCVVDCHISTASKELLVAADVAGITLEVTARDLDLDLIYKLEPPYGGAHQFRIVMYSPLIDASRTIIITNLRDGWQSLMGLLAGRLSCTQSIYISTPITEKYSMNSFVYWKNGLKIRRMHVLRDSDRWIFWQSGDIQSFEDSSRYSLLTKKRRLDRNLLISYCTALGLDPRSDDFWNSGRPAVYLIR